MQLIRFLINYQNKTDLVINLAQVAFKHVHNGMEAKGTNTEHLLYQNRIH